MESIQNPTGVKLRFLRRALKLTQSELAASLGIHPVSLCLIEKGRTPNPQNAAKIEVWIARNSGSEGNSFTRTA